jgi:hypothetical protein
MKTKPIRIALLIVAFSIATSTLQAAPSLPVTKGPVTPLNLTGPNADPPSTNGQWFLDLGGTEEYRTHEFHDNMPGHGGGANQWLAINGTVVLLTTNAAGHILGFYVDAWIQNDTDSGDTGQESAADNSHGESRAAWAERYVGTLVDTKLTAEFAIIDQSTLPTAFTGPYRQPPYPSWIIAENEDQQGWYCWNQGDPPDIPQGGYYVPTWDFGDIPTNQAVNRTLQFSVSPPMDASDPRYAVLFGSYNQGDDILANRTTSLKISTWIDDVGVDAFQNYPDEMLRSSDVSVFHNIEEEPPPPDYPHKMHWAQLPDPHGWDVRACMSPPTDPQPDGLRKVLADDFLCTSNGYITQIIFWGSWASNLFTDVQEHPYQGITNIHLSIHADIPDPDEQGPLFSMPDVPPLWVANFDPTAPPPGWELPEPVEEEPSPQGWYDPNTGFFELDNHTRYFRYEILIPTNNAFIQEEGTIYWLDISVETTNGWWGWKTTTNHWNDDAVWADLPVFNTNQWNELRDPIEPEISLDLAFIINELEPEIDWGDAPDPTYPTLSASLGANHTIDPTLYLGALIDAESDGQPNATATGDDIVNLTDEDGVVFLTSLVPGLPASISVTASKAGKLDAWIDYNGNGLWSGGEQLWGGSTGLNAGLNTLNFTVPSWATPTLSTFARFRYSTAGGLTPIGSAPDGEVEDYEVMIDDMIDWGDAPDPTYPTLSASGGAAHLISGPYLGTLVDPEFDGQPTALADGDDIDLQGDDEDGVSFLTPIIPGTYAQVSVVVGGIGGSLDAWMDFDANGAWANPGERIFTSVPLPVGAYTLSFPVPASATPATNTFARFRISTAGGLTPTGVANDGEVEDYGVYIEHEQNVDWGDAPDSVQAPLYPTLFANNGAHHVILPGMFLGLLVDPEPDGQPNVPCTGDDIDLLYPSLGDDEDGVIFTTALQPGGFAGVDVIASVAGTLDAWADFNTDGDWDDALERIFTGQPLNPGINSLVFGVPAGASQGSNIVSRFRYSTNGVASYTGLALEGEVEDHLMPEIIQLEQGDDHGDAPDPTYPTLNASGGALHVITPGVMLGATIDPEADGQPIPPGLGDDTTGLDDEDGVTFVSKVVAGTNATIDVVAGVAGGMLDAWIDFDNDGTWAHPGEHLFGASLALTPGLNAGLTFAVPFPSALSNTYARFRISTGGSLTPTGSASDGEVEDYSIDLYQPIPTNLVITNLTFLAGNTNAVVEWTVENGIVYQMEASTNLTTNVWIDVEAQVTGPNNSQTNNMAAETNKFYRVYAPMTP